tara:strand:- start:288 stop:1769 length:1482 start_codon:yes stop_codon:yes gene_type:complete
MNKYELTENHIIINIDTKNFTEDDLYIVKNLERLFLIKNLVKVQGHYIMTKHNNYKTEIKNDVRTIILPKYAGLNLLTRLKIKYEDIRIVPGKTHEIKTNIILYPNQKIICDDIENKIKRRQSHSYILVQKAGTGKTITAMAMINRLKVKTLIVLPNILLLNQWKTELLNNMDITEDEILLWNGQSNKKNKKNLTIYNNMFKIILTTIHTSVKIDPGILNENNVFFAIYDEIHLYATSTFAETFWKSQRYYNLGLTATPNKINGFEKIYIQHMNQLDFSNKIVPDNTIKFNGIVKIVKNNIKYDNILTETGIVSVPLIINNICKDDDRNILIMKYIEELYDENDRHCIFVFSDRRNHLLNIAEQMTDKRSDMNIIIECNDDTCNKNDMKVLIGGSKEDDIKDAIDNSRIIFTTYQYSSVGVNITKMNCMILATPRKNNHTQIVGRILRNGSDENIVRKIIDIVDCKSILYPQLQERKKIYIENGFKMETINGN